MPTERLIDAMQCKHHGDKLGECQGLSGQSSNKRKVKGGQSPSDGGLGKKSSPVFKLSLVVLFTR